MLLFGRVTFFGAVIASIWFAIGYGVDSAVERVILRESIDKAEHWGTYMADRVPDLEELIATGRPTKEQQDVIREVRTIGDIFRFKLFNANGQLALMSDETSFAAPLGTAATADPEVVEVARTGIPIVAVFDGSEKPDRPDLYAEAYIPLKAPDGTVRGVVEVYVNQTVTQSYFTESFRMFGAMLVVFCALVFAVPGLAYYVQRNFAQRSRRDAEYLARFDPLTGLLNRREFVTQTEHRAGSEPLSVVCYVDVDHFKKINDSHGHLAGDAFLAHIAEMLRRNCRPEDIIARFGGDEFVIAFQNVSLQDAIARVRACLKDCARDVEIQNTRLSGSISVGLSVVEDEASLEAALNNADAALYYAKSSGRNDFAVYGAEMGAELRRRHALEARLRTAIKQNEFEIHYQPLVDGSGRQIVGYEALLRLCDTDGTPIAPDVFIPLAEELGLIEEIGNWTIKTATLEMASISGDKMLAINLSTAQFLSGNLVSTVRDALSASGFAAQQLELEITESLLQDDCAIIAMQIDTLKDMGVSIAMDDFGTGFSSLSYLWRYGFDRLKIDRSFVAALEADPVRSRKIIETVVMLCERLDMKVTAEGVENNAQSRLLSELGCDILQGYLFGKAAPLHRLQAEVESSVIYQDFSSGPAALTSSAPASDPPTGDVEQETKG
ncbi:putative bifunctional diguanylate cyclase/phosphodiesterase [Roseobacter weihaiensis]|uniref:putative bifunctional diguanylate cyclase/phosphodiesterase n=1 Tax=Roseobacter weihaiensis TaxID=2763262 RepID=UPI001D0B42AC|nr:GGDEF domain-containing phosphodiesterase [Roseobacter sp. H9]